MGRGGAKKSSVFKSVSQSVVTHKHITATVKTSSLPALLVSKKKNKSTELMKVISTAKIGALLNLFCTAFWRK